jgi:chaperone modulatory protein CbpM
MTAMSSSITVYLQGEIVEESVEFTLVELSRASGASEPQLSQWVAEGAFQPRGSEPWEWRFSGRELRRALVGQRLAREFELNAAGVAVVLDLLDEIERLRVRAKQPG